MCEDEQHERRVVVRWLRKRWMEMYIIMRMLHFFCTDCTHTHIQITQLLWCVSRKILDVTIRGCWCGFMCTARGQRLANAPIYVYAYILTKCQQPFNRLEVNACAHTHTYIHGLRPCSIFKNPPRFHQPHFTYSWLLPWPFIFLVEPRVRHPTLYDCVVGKSMACIAAVTHVVAAANVNDLPVLKADICRRPTVRRLVMPLPEITVQTLRQRAQLCHKHTHTHVCVHAFVPHILASV